jgi:hypothetical protein
MGTLFLEYKIKENRREDYLSWIRNRRSEYGFELLEGSDQSGIFVELWRLVEHAETEKWMALRLNPADPVWSPLHSCVEGGSSKIHIWHFQKVE